MPFRSAVATPDELAILKEVLDEYCASHGISKDTADHHTVAGRIIFLFSNGVTSANGLMTELTRKAGVIDQSQYPQSKL